MSRLFTGSGGFDEVVVLAPGSVAANTFTWLFFWIPKAGALTTSGGIAQLRASSSPQRSIQHETDPAYYFQGFSPFGDIDVDDPAIIGYGKSSGTNAIRIHWWRESTGTWTHANGESFGNATTPDEIWLGKAFGRMSGLFIAGATWNTNLADATIANANLETGLAAWNALAPVALWAGNQAADTDPILDLTGNGADETAILGDPPAVSAEEPDGWSYDLDSGVAGEFAATLPTLTSTAAGSVSVTGTSASTLPQLSASAVGAVSADAVFAVTLPTLTTTFTGTLGARGTVAASLPPLVAAFVGDVEAQTAVLAATLAPLTAQLSGGATVAGAAAGTLPALAASLAGTVLQDVAGTLGATLPTLAASLVGTTGAGAVIVRPDTGTTVRPDTGVITRPFTGIVARP